MVPHVDSIIVFYLSLWNNDSNKNCGAFWSRACYSQKHERWKEIIRQKEKYEQYMWRILYNNFFKLYLSFGAFVFTEKSHLMIHFNYTNGELLTTIARTNEIKEYSMEILCIEKILKKRKNFSISIFFLLFIFAIFSLLCVFQAGAYAPFYNFKIQP